MERLLAELERLNFDGVLHILAGSECENLEEKQTGVYHSLLAGLQTTTPECGTVASKIIYLLHNHGFDVNNVDQEGLTALHSYLSYHDDLYLDVVEAFLRCNADVLLKNKDGEDVLGLILENRDIPRAVKETIFSYMPGIWKAVESDDAMSVRRLINQWCHVRLQRNGMSLLELACSVGTENIIRIISGIGPSLDLSHGVLSGDAAFVQGVLNSGKKLNVNVKNMRAGGATPLFYAMINGDSSMVDLLLSHGARADVSMMGSEEEEMPLYFAALATHPPVSSELLIQVIPQSPVHVENLFYMGKNVLFHCIDNDVDCAVVREILMKSSANMLVQPKQDSITCREYALLNNREDIVKVMDQIVCGWCLNSPVHRNTLLLQGYPYFEEALTHQDDAISREELSMEFCSFIQDFEVYKIQFITAVEKCDIHGVKDNLHFYNEGSFELEGSLANCRLKGDCQPPLHKAVLRQDLQVTRLLAESLALDQKIKIDTIRDQFFRTALHYAYGMEDGKELVNILVDLGASEFAMDKDGRSPLAFRDRCKQKEMKQLIQYQLEQVFDQPEPDPWSVPLPLPIMGYIAKCAHAHNAMHSHHGQSGTMHLNGHSHSVITGVNTNRQENAFKTIQQTSLRLSSIALEHENQSKSPSHRLISHERENQKKGPSHKFISKEPKSSGSKSRKFVPPSCDKDEDANEEGASESEGESTDSDDLYDLADGVDTSSDNAVYSTSRWHASPRFCVIV